MEKTSNFLNVLLSSASTDKKTPPDLAVFINGILKEIINEGVYSYQLKENGIIEYYLDGCNFDKLTIAKDYAIATAEKGLCIYSRNYYLSRNDEPLKCRTVCSFKGVNDITMMIGYGELLKSEFVINMIPMEDNKTRINISYYKDLSELREKRKGVTKDDTEIMCSSNIKPTSFVEGILDSDSVAQIVHTLLNDPLRIEELFELVQKMQEHNCIVFMAGVFFELELIDDIEEKKFNGQNLMLG